MVRAPGMDDLFGNVPQAGELPLGEQSAVSKGPPVWTRTTMRERIVGLLAELGAAEDTVPWSPRDLHGHRGMWPYYVEWLEDNDAKAMTAEFHAQLTRLGEPLVNGPFNFAWSEFETLREMAAEEEAAARSAAG